MPDESFISCLRKWCISRSTMKRRRNFGMWRKWRWNRRTMWASAGESQVERTAVARKRKESKHNRKTSWNGEKARRRREESVSGGNAIGRTGTRTRLSCFFKKDVRRSGDRSDWQTSQVNDHPFKIEKTIGSSTLLDIEWQEASEGDARSGSKEQVKHSFKIDTECRSMKDLL